MTVNSGKSGGMSSTINVTPMIDILLVLLIIFMVIVPAMPKGEATLVPNASVIDPRCGDAVVLEVKGDDQLSFTQVAEVIDIGHAAGVDRIGLMTPKVHTGQ